MSTAIKVRKQNQQNHQNPQRCAYTSPYNDLHTLCTIYTRSNSRNPFSGARSCPPATRATTRIDIRPVLCPLSYRGHSGVSSFDPPPERPRGKETPPLAGVGRRCLIARFAVKGMAGTVLAGEQSEFVELVCGGQAANELMSRLGPTSGIQRKERKFDFLCRRISYGVCPPFPLVFVQSMFSPVSL